ncbi:MAG: hypothetical protein ISR00_03635 [Flavobacteriales bacterium]|nr:hypothetical protein [Flavobacteriales bacterium]MBL6873025.1 hypothetical protein [Flavobacteriales bacterium]
MKHFYKYLSLLVIVLLVASCNSFTYLPTDEYEKFTVKANEVFYNNNAVAKMGPMEYEYSAGNFILEVSLIQYSAVYDEMTKKIAQFMSQRHPKAKIEIKVPRDDQMDK